LEFDEREPLYVKVNKKQETSKKGVFSAGDMTNNPFKQVITAAGEGAIAAYTAYNEIEIEKEQ
jgi:thioredoxin reductase